MAGSTGNKATSDQLKLKLKLKLRLTITTFHLPTMIRIGQKLVHLRMGWWVGGLLDEMGIMQTQLQLKLKLSLAKFIARSYWG